MENGHIENEERFLFIQMGLNGTSLKKGQRHMPNEHSNHEQSIFWLLFPEIIIFNNLGLLKTFGF